MLRRKKTGQEANSGQNPVLDGQEIIDAQRFQVAIRTALIVSAVTVAAWMLSASFSNRVFPWFVILQGVAIGLAVRRWGRGFDWRFPMLAASCSLLAAYVGNFLIAAHNSAGELGTSTANVVFNITGWTLDVYFAEVITPADHIFALYGAVLAAYFAGRKLSRHEIYALRIFRDD